MKRKLPTFMWCGFTDDKADLIVQDRGDDTLSYGVLYPTRAAARRFYQDVRKVEIREVRRSTRRS